MTAIRKVPWTSQPQVLVPPDPTWVARGMKFVYTPTQQCVLQSNSSFGVSQYKKIHTNANNSAFGVTKQSISIPTGADVTVMILARPTSKVGSNATLFAIPNSASWVAPYAPVMLRHNLTGNLTTWFGQADSSFEELASSSTYTADSAWHWFEMKRKGNAVEWFVDGISYGTATATKTPTYAGNKDATFFGTPLPSTAEAFAGDCAFGMFADEYIADTSNLRLNPWQVFAPLPRLLWAPAAAAGGFKPYWALNRTQIIGAGHV